MTATDPKRTVGCIGYALCGIQMNDPFEVLRKTAANYPFRTLLVLLIVNSFFVLALHSTEIEFDGITLALAGQISGVTCLFALAMYLFIRYM